MVRASFTQRRKTISNNLKARFFPKEGRERLEELLAAAGIEPSRRGETLSLAEYARLSDVLLEAGIS
ncbi:Ribosomal RNA small subunit methyltransferase A [compost metagenome]